MPTKRIETKEDKEKMFNVSLRKEALDIHEEMIQKYNHSYKKMSQACEKLYQVRERSVDMIRWVEQVINTIANTPKEFGTQLGKAGKELVDFHKTEEYAKEAYEKEIKAGVNIVGGAAAGAGIAAMAPTAMVSIATTFGTASTGTAISALSGAAAQKAALAWIGRTFAGIAVKEGAGTAAGEAFLALAGPIGWGITAASMSFSLISLSARNKKLADQAVNEAKEAVKIREATDEAKEKIEALVYQTDRIYNELDEQTERIMGLKYTQQDG